MDAEEAIKRDLVDDLVILLDLLLKELTNEALVDPVALLQDLTEEAEEGSLVTRQFSLDNQDVPQTLQLVRRDARSLDLSLLKNVKNSIQTHL